MRDILREHGVDFRLGLADADEAADEAAAARELGFRTEASDDDTTPSE